MGHGFTWISTLSHLGVPEVILTSLFVSSLLVVFGSQDDLVDPQSAQGYRSVPGARVVVLDGVGHSPHVERPAATARLIADFIAQQRR